MLLKIDSILKDFITILSTENRNDMKHSCGFRQAGVLMGTSAPKGLAFLTVTPARPANIATILLVTAERCVCYVLPDITVTDWELPCL